MDYSSMTVPEFLDAIASERVAPAGGTAAGVVGAVGASLCEMSCLHTLENREHAGEDLEEIRDNLHTQRDRLLALGTQDAEIVDRLFGSEGGDPKSGDPKRSLGVPLTIAEACLAVIELGAEVLATGKESTTVDTKTGIWVTEAALNACLYTVRANADTVEDDGYAAEMVDRCDEIERAVEEIAKGES